MKMYYNEKGEEIPDPTKPELPLGFKKPESLAEQVRRLVRSEQVRLAAEKSGHESFDEADDFEVGEDYDPRSPYEEIFDPTSNEAPEVVQELEKRKAKKPKKEPKKDPPESAPEGSGEEVPRK